ncbi:hypothetical protein VTI74DRAFT_11165 [Chaetomium olivicolor]
MEALRAMLACILGRRERLESYMELIYDDKMAALYSDAEPYASSGAMSYHHHSRTLSDLEIDTRSVEEVAREVARLLWLAQWNDDALQSRISDAVGEHRRWTRKMVEECLDNVIEYVEQGRDHGMGDAMCEVLDRVTDVADDEFAFPRGHPESLDGFIAIVSVGVLAELQGAWVLEMLGFGEVKGKVEIDGTGEVAMSTSDKIVFSTKPKPGSVADWWARKYEAYIPSGSAFSFLHRLDMVDLEE